MSWVSVFGRQGGAAWTHMLPLVGANGREYMARSWSFWSLAELLIGLLFLPVVRLDRNMDQIFEPSLLSCVYLRKPLALKQGPGLVL